MVKVVWTDSAIEDLNEIAEYIAKDSIRYAEVVVEKLFNSVDILESFPKAGKTVQFIKDINIRELIRFNYRIVYHIVNEFRIDILTIHRCERSIENSYDFSSIDG